MPIEIPIQTAGTVSGLLDSTEDPFALYVLAHGSGVGMQHAFMASVAIGLAARGVSVLRFDFPFMQAGSRRPDRPAVAHAAVRAAVAKAAALAPGLPLFAGGKSFGGRMTSQAQAASPLPGVVGLAFLGFPLHPAGKPSISRATHLDEVSLPKLFVQGTRDALADIGLLGQVVARWADAALSLVEDAGHALQIPARTGRSNTDVLDQVCELTAGWIRSVVEGARNSAGRDGGAMRGS